MPPTPPQRARSQTQREARGMLETTQGRNYTPEHAASPRIQEITGMLTSRRKTFERSSDIAAYSPLKRIGGDISTHYEERGWHDIEHEHAAAAPAMQDFEHLAEHGHNPFPLPTRWEDLPKEEQARSHAGLKAHGTSMKKMAGDIGRGLDRAYTRSSEMGAIPFASNFYEPEGFARQILGRTMEHAPPEHQVAAISMTSPRNKFIQITQDQRVQMPNVNAAYAAGQLAQSGRYTTGPQFKKIAKIGGGPDWNLAKKIGAEISGGGIGMPDNVAKAAWGLHQGAKGAPISEWMGLPSKTSPKGNPLFGGSPKVSPFAASFLDEAPPFHVGDIHMQGVAFPHLSTRTGSGVNINPSGADVGKKSEREVAMERIPHAHAAMDYAMRNAMGERGLSKTRFQQGAAWGEQQIARTLHPEPGGRKLNYDPERVYGWQKETMPSTTFTARTKRGTGTLYLPG